MIVIDTSVLIRQFRNYDGRRATHFVQFAPVVCGPVRSEFFAGARKPAQVAACEKLIAPFASLLTPEPIWEAAGRTQARLANSGLIVPLNDTVIATVAVDAGAELWAYDAHFGAMAALIPGLRLFQEPP